MHLHRVYLEFNPLKVTETIGRGIRELLVAHPSHSEVVRDLLHPWVGITKEGNGQPECYNQEGL